MKNYKMLISLILLLWGMNNIFAQTEITEADLKAALSSVFDASVKENYTKAVTQYFEALKLKCLQYKIKYVEADTNKDFNTILTTYMIERKKFV